MTEEYTPIASMSVSGTKEEWLAALSKPDHRTHEQRILASSEATLRVLEEIRDLQRERLEWQRDVVYELTAIKEALAPPAHLKPKARK